MQFIVPEDAGNVNSEQAIMHDSVIELRMDSLAHNLQLIRQVVGAGIRISSVVKGNAYGHGLLPFVEMALSCGIDHFAVANAREARQLDAALQGRASLMVMGLYAPADLPWMIRKGIEFFVGSREQLEQALQVAKQTAQKALIHLEVETGLNRLGMPEDQLPAALELICAHQARLELTGLCSQLSGAGKPGNEQRVQAQYRRFDRIVEMLAVQNLHPRYLHIDSSISTLTCFSPRYNMVRIGTAQYGIYVNYHENIHRTNHIQARLRRVMTWKTKVFSTRTVPVGESIGYGSGAQQDKPGRIAILPVGYHDGYRRYMPQGAYVMIRGQAAPLIGLVNMNSCCADISNIENVQAGDEVILLGGDPDAVIHPESFFPPDQFVNGIEFPARLHPDIPRFTPKQ